MPRRRAHPENQNFDERLAHSSLKREIIYAVRDRLTERLRIGEGYTQARIARSMGVSTAYVSDLLNPDRGRDMQLATAVALLHAVGLRLIVVADADADAALDE